MGESLTPYSLIRDAIISREFPQQAQLVETVLAAKYQVSRTPIREALRRLESEGLVVRSGSSMRVREYQSEEMVDLYEARMFLEEAAAKTAAIRHTPMDLVLIDRAHQAMVDIDFASTGATELAAVNMTFHERIWAASHSPALVDLLNRVQVHFIRYPGTTLATRSRWNQVLEEHADLITAIRNRDDEAARRIAGSHLETAKNIRIGMYIDAQTSADKP
ncbi:MAG: GntR family transcriptional regulator [Lacisediminihabitans sp.]